MRPFLYQRPAATPAEAAARVAASPDAADVAYLAGGTTMADLMKIDVLTPARVESVGNILPADITKADDGLKIGAGCTMARVADHPLVIELAPAVRHSLILAASPQIRHMATIAGNLLQRSRCPYYRHPSWEAAAGRGAEAPDPTAAGADDDMAALLGVTADYTPKYPGDFGAVAAAFDVQVQTVHPDGGRTIPVRELHDKSSPAPHAAPVLRPGELVTHLTLPTDAATANSWYLKVRERSSYAFALASAAVGLDLDGDDESATVTAAKIGLGGVASRPWHSPEAEAALVGRPATDANFVKAADAALASATPRPGQEWKVELAERTLVRALIDLRDRGVPTDAALFAQQHGRG